MNQYIGQSSRFSKELTAALEKDPELTPGLNEVCATCGKRGANFECKMCKAIVYCDAKCYNTDTKDASDAEPMTEEGHSKRVCEILRGIVNDESMSAEEQKFLFQSEIDSYPKTMSHIINSQDAFGQLCLDKASKKQELTIHVAGAEDGSELTYTAIGDTTIDPIDGVSQQKTMLDEECEAAYMSCLQGISDEFGIDIRLIIIGAGLGPYRRSARQTNNKDIILECVRAESYQGYLASHCYPDILCFYNPGFTCPDYDWMSALERLPISGVLFFATTNTLQEMEMDIEYLSDQKIRDEKKSFYDYNPEVGTRIRQSGVFANDLYVKNMMIYGGILRGKGESLTASSSLSSLKRKQPDSM